MKKNKPATKFEVTFTNMGRTAWEQRCIKISTGTRMRAFIDALIRADDSPTPLPIEDLKRHSHDPRYDHTEEKDGKLQLKP